MNQLLWVVQTLLALLFVFAGAEKQVMSAAELTGPTPLPAAFLRFIGVMEILGGLGLMLPGMLRIRTALTALAAGGLVVIMIGAVVVTIQTMGLAMASLPLVTGALALFVAYGRWRVAPLDAPHRMARRQSAHILDIETLKGASASEHLSHDVSSSLTSSPAPFSTRTRNGHLV